MRCKSRCQRDLTVTARFIFQFYQASSSLAPPSLSLSFSARIYTPVLSLSPLCSTRTIFQKTFTLIPPLPARLPTRVLSAYLLPLVLSPPRRVTTRYERVVSSGQENKFTRTPGALETIGREKEETPAGRSEKTRRRKEQRSEEEEEEEEEEAHHDRPRERRETNERREREGGEGCSGGGGGRKGLKRGTKRKDERGERSSCFPLASRERMQFKTHTRKRGRGGGDAVFPATHTRA